MKEEMHAYLERVVRHSGLSKREQADWIEEMSAHLHVEMQRLVECGHDESDALMLACTNFGEPLTLRRKITRETLGTSIANIYGLALLFFTLFLVAAYLLRMNFHPIGWNPPQNWSPNKWLTLFTRGLPLSPSLMLALCASSLSLLKTRCRRDRLGIAVTLAVYGALWMTLRSPVSNVIQNLIFELRHMMVNAPLVFVVTGIFVLWGLALYSWTRNPWVSLFPIFLSIVVGLWPVLFIQSGFSLWEVVVRCVPIVILLLVFRVIESYSSRRRASTVS